MFPAILVNDFGIYHLASTIMLLWMGLYKTQQLSDELPVFFDKQLTI